MLATRRLGLAGISCASSASTESPPDVVSEVHRVLSQLKAGPSRVNVVPAVRCRRQASSGHSSPTWRFGVHTTGFAGNVISECTSRTNQQEEFPFQVAGEQTAALMRATDAGGRITDATGDKLVEEQAGGSSKGVGSLSVAAAGLHALVLSDNCTVPAWRRTFIRRLGTARPTARRTPLKVPDPSAVTVLVGCWHAFATRDNGTAYAWGCTSSGEIGDGTTTDSQTPAPVRHYWREDAAKRCGALKWAL